jgi:mycothiol system anti-sigma-R factor
MTSETGQETGRIAHDGSSRNAVVGDSAANAAECTEGPCTEAKNHLWDYLDGELDPGDCARIKAHVQKCPPCEQLFSGEKKIKDAVSRACGCEHAPQDLRGRIISMIATLRAESCGGSRSQNQAASNRSSD